MDPRQGRTGGSRTEWLPRDEGEQSFLEKVCQRPPAGNGASPIAFSSRTFLPVYELMRELGRGGMGVVYLARQTTLNRLTAVKMLATEGTVGTRELVRFQIEAEAAAALWHPNIVQIYEVGEHGGRPFLALEYVEGVSLARRLASEDHTLPPRSAAELVETLARAIHTAHLRGIVHRDLKPANVLLGVSQAFQPDSGVRLESLTYIPKITDFGLAKQLGRDGPTYSQETLGTPGYMAPEQARGDWRNLGPATDVYALGAILYECLTGTPPPGRDSHSNAPARPPHGAASSHPGPPGAAT